MPAILAVQETVAVPEPVTPDGLNAPHVRPPGTVSVNVTVPAKWLTDATVTVEVGDVITLTAAGEATIIVKSPNLNNAVALCINGELVPVIVSV